MSLLILVLLRVAIGSVVLRGMRMVVKRLLFDSVGIVGIAGIENLRIGCGGAPVSSDLKEAC